MSKLQVRTLTFQLVTKADEPLGIAEETMDELCKAVDKAAQQFIDLRYGGKFDEKRHEYIGVMLP